jgi:PAS domain S-box-containing protein
LLHVLTAEPGPQFLTGSDQVNLVSNLLLLSFLVYLYLGITTYRFNKESHINSQMMVICLNFALWSFAYMFMHISGDLETAFLWYRLATIGWLYFLPLIVHLLVLMSRNERIINRAFLLVIYGTPSAALVWVNVFLIDTSIMHRVAGGWTTVYDIGIVWTTLYLAAYYVILCIGWYALYRWGVKSPYKREKKQVRIFLVTSIISMTLASVFDNILPFAGVVRFPLVAPVITLVWMFGLWYAIQNYGMMKIDTSFAASEIINNMNDLLFLTDREGIIRQTNQHSCRILGMDTCDITGKTVSSLVRFQKPIENAMRQFRESPRGHSSIEVDIMPRNGNDIPVRFSISVLRDGEGDILGIVFVGYDLRETRKLRQMQSLTQTEMEMAAQVQTRLFHNTSPKDAAWDIDIVFRPLYPVSGDFYDFYESDGILRGVSLFDVSGHGVSAGLITMTARSIVFRSFTSMNDLPLDEVLAAINDELFKEIGQLDDFVTGILLRSRENVMEYVNAAHPHLILRHADGTVEVITSIYHDNRGTFLGTYEGIRNFRVMKFEVNPGDQLLAYTDALIECLGDAKRHYGLDRLVASFRSAPDGSAQEIMAHIMADMEHFIGGNAPKDDLTAILLRRRQA